MRGDTGDKMRGNTRCPVETRSMSAFKSSYSYINMGNIFGLEFPYALISFYVYNQNMFDKFILAHTNISSGNVCF